MRQMLKKRESGGGVKSVLFGCISVAILCIPGCISKQAANGKPTVFVTIPPQKYFVDRISGGMVVCLVMVPPGANEHSYEPHPVQMSLLSKAKVYFAVGLELENSWLPKFSALSPSMKIVHTDGSAPKIALPRSVDISADSYPVNRDVHHDHNGLDPHIWLSPKLVKLQAASIAEALESSDTMHASIYRANFISFVRDIDSLENRLRIILPCDSTASLSQHKTFLVFHPAWGYFAHDFCLDQISIEVEGKEPSPKTMKTILDLAHHKRIQTVFIQPEFSRKSAEVIANELGASVLEADALAYDWEKNLIAVATRIAVQ
jgi:zinc transport system substrate-binding protein